MQDAAGTPRGDFTLEEAIKAGGLQLQGLRAARDADAKRGTADAEPAGPSSQPLDGGGAPGGNKAMGAPGGNKAMGATEVS